MTGPETKPRQRQAKLAPPAKISERALIILEKKDQHSDLAYFADSFFPIHQVPFREKNDKSLLAAIDNSRSAFRNMRTEGTCQRGKRRCNVNVQISVGYSDPNDEHLIHQKATVITVQETRWNLKEGCYPNVGLYAVRRDEEWLYVGRSEKDLLARIDEHFHRRRASDIRHSTKFTQYCQKNLYESSSWEIWLIAPEACQSIVKKSFFLDREEYEKHAIQFEEEYRAWIDADPRRYLYRAEGALIELLSPRYNVRGNHT